MRFLGGLRRTEADNGDDAIRDAQKNRKPECVAALRVMKRTANLLDTMFINNMMSVIEQMDAGVEELSDIRQEFREYFGFTPNHRATGTPENFMCRLQNCEVVLSIADCFAYRPVQEKIHRESPIPLSGRGLGWDTTEGKQWFSQNLPERRRRAATSREISKDRLITRTMTHIRFTVGQSGEKLYEFQCDDMKKLVEGNTSLNAQEAAANDNLPVQPRLCHVSAI